MPQLPTAGSSLSTSKSTRPTSALSISEKIERAVERIQKVSMIPCGPTTRGERARKIAEICEEFGFAEKDVIEDIRLVRDGASLGARMRIDRRLQMQA